MYHVVLCRGMAPAGLSLLQARKDVKVTVLEAPAEPKTLSGEESGMPDEAADEQSNA